ncbi:hypothetical protein O181_051247 [Austropuccinia psidii MF-1]|uniref:Uncharacterized protein n=1 Tax=Austropuccinia psidii MF-1 TaxID=1389203 RepID=A0A9Q3E5B2_9BASI|nr:hypothetical protein [Austropuccinia psidii MF-1]
MWVVINLPPKYKFIGEMWLQECQIGKKSPSIDEAIEEIQTENLDHKAFLVKKQDKEEGQKKKDTDKSSYHPCNTCKPGYHNPLPRQTKSDCWNLKIRPKTALICSISNKDKTSIVLESGGSNSMFNNQKFFQNFTPKE